MSKSRITPLDAHNQELLSFVHPPDYRNPKPAGRYNLVVIGGGTAGLVTAAGAAGLGAKVALVERHLLGGDCLNVGCVPSKALIRSARAAAEVRDAKRFGIQNTDQYEVDFPTVMERMRKLRAQIAPVDSTETLRKKGVDVFLGDARFLNSETVVVGETQLRFARAVIATGARASLPPIPGIDDVSLLTNENLFSLTELPTSLAIIGSGSIGAEMAQVFARFGSKVTVFDIASEFLPREDPAAAAIVKRALEHDNVRFLLGVAGLHFQPAGDKQVSIASDASPQGDTFDAVLIATGRTANVDGLDLDRVGVKVNDSGVVVNDRLRTTNSRIYACGDVASLYKFTHAADALARIVIGNALFFGTHRASSLNIPRAIYTAPEIAHVGVDNQNRQTSRKLLTIELPFSESDRAILDSQDDGLLKILHDHRGQILGATIVAAHAGELIGEIVVAMNHNIRLSALASDIHPYPTQSEILKRAGDTYRRSMLTPQIAGLLKRILAWRR